MPIADLPADGTAAGIRVLVADDDKGARTLFATLLRAAAGVTSVIEAKDGAEAVELGSEQRLDVAVLDFKHASPRRCRGCDHAARAAAVVADRATQLRPGAASLARRGPRPAVVRQGRSRPAGRMGRAAGEQRAGNRPRARRSHAAKGRPLLLWVRLRHRQSHAADALSHVWRRCRLDRATRLELAAGRASGAARRLNAGQTSDLTSQQRQESLASGR